MSEKSQNTKDPLLGLALIMYSMEMENTLSRADAFAYVLDGACRKLGYSQDDVRAYLLDNLERVKAIYKERRPA